MAVYLPSKQAMRVRLPSLALCYCGGQAKSRYGHNSRIPLQMNKKQKILTFSAAFLISFLIIPIKVWYACGGGPGPLDELSICYEYVFWGRSKDPSGWLCKSIWFYRCYKLLQLCLASKSRTLLVVCHWSINYLFTSRVYLKQSFQKKKNDLSWYVIEHGPEVVYYPALMKQKPSYASVLF